MLRLTILCVAMGSLAQVLPPGCQPTDEPTGDETLPLEVTLSVLETVAGGETVELSVSLVGDGDASAVSYRWYQTYGREVTLQSVDTATASFVAPRDAKDLTLRFRVIARRTDGEIASVDATVTVMGDPALGDDETDGGGAADDGTDGGSQTNGGDGSADDDGTTSLTDPPTTDTPGKNKVYLITTKGQITIELYPDDAPKTVKNFRVYVDEGFYRSVIFHRVIADFMIQAGGFTSGMVEKDPTHSPVENESDNGLKNLRGTVAMARSNDPDSATSQFFINVVDNEDLDYQDGAPGYTVFGKVIEGMDVVDIIAAVETHTFDGHADVPVDDITIIRVGFLD